ncbi:uncharacterized protein LOC120675430 [Panicum virgatum]|uniref:Uncharacterized protein n=1 Tax=Panicum virgatum TaxID=38727 RepID=A0A8T0S0A0_PANVG|nr:uncharacterized protein LOC120675430 [Panicum virgatum]KAG2591104.1 hypothetical protein PVAP13_5NG444400 [Panicum virgatum]
MPKHTFALSVILLILLFNASAGQTIVVGNDNAITAKLIMGHSRKILTEVQDYDYGGANSRHDPRRRPGIGGRNG